MVECKILHINEGKERELTNGNWFYASEMEKTEQFLTTYINQGFKVKQMIPQISPGDDGSFYNDGFIVYLEREK